LISIELIEAIKKIDDMNEHALPEETENQTISIEVPIINFPSKLNDKFNKEISCTQIFYFVFIYRKLNLF
jgi:hypothetical protein